MRLVARHGRRRVVEDADREVRLIVDTVDDARDRRGEERRIADEGKALHTGRHSADALRDIDACPHAEAGVDHVERHGIAERVAANVAAENTLLPLHRALDRIERSAVRAAGTEHRRAHDGDRWFRQRRGLRLGPPHERGDIVVDRVARVLASPLDIARELAADLDGQLVLAAEEDELAFDDGVEFLEAEHLVEPLQEFDRELLREWERRRDLEHARHFLPLCRPLCERLCDVRVADTLRRDAAAAGAWLHLVARIRRKDLA